MTSLNSEWARVSREILCTAVSVILYYYYYYHYHHHYHHYHHHHHHRLLSQVFFSWYFSWTPPLRLQVSRCSTSRIMCDVPSIAVFCSESIECFPGTASKLFFKLLVTIPVPPLITGKIVHFRFHICCISIPKLLYFTFFFRSILHDISVCGYCHASQLHVFSFLFLIILSGLFAVTSLSVCTGWFNNTVLLLLLLLLLSSSSSSS